MEWVSSLEKASESILIHAQILGIRSRGNSLLPEICNQINHELHGPLYKRKSPLLLSISGKREFAFQNNHIHLIACPCNSAKTKI